MVFFDLMLSVKVNIRKLHNARYPDNKYPFKEDVSRDS